MPQGRFQNLLQAPEGQRSSILKGVFGLQKIGKIRERAKAIAEEKRSKVDELRDKQTTLAPDPELELKEYAQLKDGHEQREAILAESVRVCVEIKDNKREIGRLLEENQRQLERLRGDVAVVEELGDLSGLLHVEQELAEKQANLEERQKALETEKERCARRLEAYREAGEDETSLEVASFTLKDLAEEYPRLKEGLRTNERRQKGLEEKRNELQKREASHEKAAAEAKKAQESHDTIHERYLNVLGAAQGLDLKVAKDRDQEQKRRVEAATVELERAERIRAEARERQEAVRDEHAALHLARELEPGESCPVCTQTVPQNFRIPMHGPSDEELSEAMVATDEAERAYQARL